MRRRAWLREIVGEALEALSLTIFLIGGAGVLVILHGLLSGF